MAHIAYVETPEGIWRETNGVMDGPFTREELDFPEGVYIPQCSTLQCRFETPASISFGFGHGLKADNSFGE